MVRGSQGKVRTPVRSPLQRANPTFGLPACSRSDPGKGKNHDPLRKIPAPFTPRTHHVGARKGESMERTLR
jgi:hypothetical protein